MGITIVLLVLATICAIWAVVAGILLTRWLDQRGLRTPFPFIRLFLFRNLGRYKEITRKERGKVGPLFYSYVVPINIALALVLIVAAIRISGT